MPRTLAALAVLLCALPAAAADAPKEIVFRECLVIPRVGSYGRSPLHGDAIEALIVAGKWSTPKAGDTVKLPDGTTRAWEKLEAGKDGTFSHRALGGGYALVTVPSDRQRVMILEAAGHMMAYVNGEPRAGDPYSHGFLHLPVLLKKGNNEFLFHVGRGRLKARLVEPKAPAYLDTSDVTFPDLIKGKDEALQAAVLVVNASTEPLEKACLFFVVDGLKEIRIPLRTIPPLSVRKVGFEMNTGVFPPPVSGNKFRLSLWQNGKEPPLFYSDITFRIRKPEESHKRTFVSGIDGSVQYYAVQPMRPAKDAKPAGKPALFLTLHGAAVEATGQADAYAGKSWGHIVAPTNRRPYGFDWEDWGRLDALEVLAAAQKQFGTDPRRTYLTGHSMGGHGVWHLGATFPDRWAAIGPSAGWISFWTYAGGRRPDKATPMQEMLLRAASPSNTPLLASNYANHGVYVLHGDADDNVPVGQAREMRRLLGQFHPDFAYHEQPGAGHWWGSPCVDWPPLFDFFQRRTLPKREDVRQVHFVTLCPGVSAWCHWAGIEAQAKPMKPSSISLRCDRDKRRFTGTTDNVARLALDLGHLKAGEPIHVELDGQKVENVAWPEKGQRIWLTRTDGKWQATGQPPASVKGPHRCGPFKDAFRNRMMFVYGTGGNAAEKAWAFAKARYDAEAFYYRGNGSVEVVADTAFDPKAEKDRNVILYGNADTNAAWKPLLGNGPVQVRKGVVKIGDREEKGDALACLFLRPRPGSDRASVAAISGTGIAGMRLTDRLPYFVSGVGYPDCLVFSPEVLERGAEGVRAAGFFGQDWGVQTGEFVWKE